MQPDDAAFLKAFYGALDLEAIGPESKFYQKIYDNPALATDDPVELLANGIIWKPGGSAQLFSGFRGTGKSTELRRLRQRLQDEGFLVVLIDLEKYVNLTTPIDISDFLMELCGAFGEALADPALLGKDIGRESGWEKMEAFLRKLKTFSLSEVSLDAGSSAKGTVGLFEAGSEAKISLKGNLRDDPSFKRQLQEHLEGHVSQLVDEVRAFFGDCVRRLKEKFGVGQEIALLVDSLERLRGTSTNAEAVQASVENLFAGHSNHLKLQGEATRGLHIVYTVPPYLKVRHPGIGALYGSDLVLLPSLKVKNLDGSVHQAGLDALADVVRRRGDWLHLMGSRERFDRLARLSGGHLRDLFRLLSEVLRRAKGLPVGDREVDAAISQVRGNFLPIAHNDLDWLIEVARTHEANLDDRARLPDLAHFFDTHLVLCYRNGEDWYDVHPLIAGVVEQHDLRKNPLPPPKKARKAKDA